MTHGDRQVTERNVTLRIRVKKVMAAVMSVLLILTLVTAISFDMPVSVLFDPHQTRTKPTASPYIFTSVPAGYTCGVYAGLSATKTILPPWL